MAPTMVKVEPCQGDYIKSMQCDRDWWKERAVNRPVPDTNATGTETSYNGPCGKLPADIWQMVYSYLETKDLLSLSHVSWGFAIELNVDEAWQEHFATMPSQGYERYPLLNPRQRVLLRTCNLNVKICALCLQSSLVPFATFNSTPGLSHWRGCKACLPLRYEQRMCVAEAKSTFKLTNKDIKKDRLRNKKKRFQTTYTTHYIVLDWYEYALRLAEAKKKSAETGMGKKLNESLVSEPESGGEGCHDDGGSSFVDYDPLSRESEAQLVMKMGEVTITL